jgi:hypothetical protein
MLHWNVYHAINEFSSVNNYIKLFIIYMLSQQLMMIIIIIIKWPPLWSSGQSSWLQTQRSRVWFPALPHFLSSSGFGTGSTQRREYKWWATWMKKWQFWSRKLRLTALGVPPRWPRDTPLSAKVGTKIRRPVAVAPSVLLACGVCFVCLTMQYVPIYVRN